MLSTAKNKTRKWKENRLVIGIESICCLLLLRCYTSLLCSACTSSFCHRMQAQQIDGFWWLHPLTTTTTTTIPIVQLAVTEIDVCVQLKLVVFMDVAHVSFNLFCQYYSFECCSLCLCANCKVYRGPHRMHLSHVKSVNESISMKFILLGFFHQTNHKCLIWATLQIFALWICKTVNWNIWPICNTHRSKYWMGDNLKLSSNDS